MELFIRLSSERSVSLYIQLGIKSHADNRKHFSDVFDKNILTNKKSFYAWLRIFHCNSTNNTLIKKIQWDLLHKILYCTSQNSHRMQIQYRECPSSIILQTSAETGLIPSAIAQPGLGGHMFVMVYEVDWQDLIGDVSHQ